MVRKQKRKKEKTRKKKTPTTTATAEHETSNNLDCNTLHVPKARTHCPTKCAFTYQIIMMIIQHRLKKKKKKAIIGTINRIQSRGLFSC